jgi:hypothetical protein
MHIEIPTQHDYPDIGALGSIAPRLTVHDAVVTPGMRMSSRWARRAPASTEAAAQGPEGEQVGGAGGGVVRRPERDRLE